LGYFNHACISFYSHNIYNFSFVFFHIFLLLQCTHYCIIHCSFFFLRFHICTIPLKLTGSHIDTERKGNVLGLVHYSPNLGRCLCCCTSYIMLTVSLVSTGGVFILAAHCDPFPLIRE
jgi:hypothetical protein